MSLKTWKAVFYPESATKPRTWIDATKHSIQKWKGLSKTNIKRHKLKSAGGELYEADDDTLGGVPSMVISDENCALCRRAQAKSSSYMCHVCPIFEMRGKSCCDGRDNEYYSWIVSGNHKPMLKLLKQTLKFLEEKGK